MNNDIGEMLSSVLSDPKALEKAATIANMLSSSGMLSDLMSGISKEDPPIDTVPFQNQKSEHRDASRDVPRNVADDIVRNISPRSVERESTARGASMNDRVALLRAMRPFLPPERAQKLDSIIRLMGIIGVLEKSLPKLLDGR